MDFKKLRKKFQNIYPQKFGINIKFWTKHEIKIIS